MTWIILLVTVVITALIVYVDYWIKKNREKHPTLFQHKSALAMVVYLVVSLITGK